VGLALPIIVLYEISIIAVRIAQSRAQKMDDDWDDEGDNDDEDDDDDNK